MNVHGFRSQGLALDAVMNCTLERQRQSKTNNLEQQQNNPTTTPLMFTGCSALSGMVPAKDIKDARNGIGGFIATPIYPANDPLVLVGYIFGIVYWLEVMTDMVRIIYFYYYNFCSIILSLSLSMFLFLISYASSICTTKQYSSLKIPLVSIVCFRNPIQRILTRSRTGRVH